LAKARVERHLAAIFAADVAGYSRLMGADEEGTHAQLRAHRSELCDPAIERHRGHIANTAGDSILAEFGSVVDAVTCAVEIQRSMRGRNSEVLPDKRIEFRIGINLGDVITDGTDISATGSMSRPGSKASPIAAAFAFRAKCWIRSKASSI
jgi:class 3 adenylate cyclase